VDWVDPAKRGPLVREHMSKLITESIEFVRSASQLHENLITWRPRDVEVETGPLAEGTPAALYGGWGSRAIEQAAGLAVAMRSLPASMASKAGAAPSPRSHPNRGQTPAPTGDLLDRLHALRQTLVEIDSDDDADPKLSGYLARRLAEIQVLETRLTDWAERFMAIEDGSFPRVAAVTQQRLQTDTETFGIKLEDLANRIGSMVPAAGDKMTELVAIATGELPPLQLSAVVALEGDDVEAAGQAAQEAVAAFERAEGLFDEVLSLVEDFLASMPVVVPPDAGDGPSIEDELARLLAALEEEREACESLGTVVRSNLMIQTDWMRKSEAGSGTGGPNGQTQAPSDEPPQQPSPPQEQEQRGPRPPSDAELQAAIREALASSAAVEEMLRQMQSRAERADREAAPAQTAPAAAAVASGVEAGDAADGERDWNVFVSQLEDQLRQARGQIPPEEYREAINAYFRRLAEAQARSLHENPSQRPGATENDE
jgi:hypothetical protein